MLQAVLMVVAASSASAGGKEESGLGPGGRIQEMLNHYCIECHDHETQKGDVRLDNFTELRETLQFDLLNRVEEQVFVGSMPPEKADQPTGTEREVLFTVINRWNELAGKKSLFRAKLESPAYGNYLDHHELFSGEHGDLKGFTRDRKWLISEHIFREKMNRLLRIAPSKKVRVDGQYSEIRGFALDPKVANPFLLPSGSGVRYFANEKLGSGHLMSMIGSSSYVSEAMINHLSAKYSDFLPSVQKIARMKAEQEAVLEARDVYLDNQIDRLCQELYGGENEAWLPGYTKIKFKDVSGILPMIDPEGYFPQRKYNTFRNTDGRVIEMGFYRFASEAEGEELIRRIEKYMFHLGLPHDKIELNIERLLVNLDAFLEYSAKEREKRSAPWKLDKPTLPAAEVKTVASTIRQLRTKGMSYYELHGACMDHWRAEFEAALQSSNPIAGSLSEAIVTELYGKIHEREPGDREMREKVDLLLSFSTKMGVLEGIAKLTQTMLLSSEFMNRNEYGVGAPDDFGRRMMSPRDASYAIAYALTDSSPDQELASAAREGRLTTREDYRREVQRLLGDRSHLYIIDNVIHETGGKDNVTDQPIRKVRFFREFFGYDEALEVFKDEKRFGRIIDGTRQALIAEADLLVAHILEKDQDVFEELLTTDKFFVYHNGDNERVGALSAQLTAAYRYFEKHGWRDFKSAEDLEEHREFIVNHGVPGLKMNGKPVASGRVFDAAAFQLFINIMSDFERRFEGGKNEHIAPYSNTRGTFFGPERKLAYQRMPGHMKYEDVALYYNIDPDRWDYPPQQPAKLEHRKGILTHPAWLQAFSQNAHTDPVIRGKWVREKLLAGTIPDLPIGVEAQVPPDHTKTFRQRLASVTQEQYCWRCHQAMNPLGNPFEMYDDFGRYRTEEELEHPDNVVGQEPIRKARIKTHPLQTVNNRGVKRGNREFYKTLPVDATGLLEGTGDRELDGEVEDALDMIGRLARSSKVRQSIIRHAFRYFMGRNETLSDSKSLMDADAAYVNSGGSFDAVIVSLLTSDSFIYRKANQPPDHD